MSAEEEDMACILRQSAATIEQQSETVTRRRYAQFIETCKARTKRQVLNQQAEMDTYAEAWDKDVADYERAVGAEESGDLHTAAEWYRKAAGNDFADSARKLAEVLEGIARRHLTKPGGRAAACELQLVVEEASKAYIAAFMAGDIDEDELGPRLDQLLNYLHPARASNRPVLTIAASAEPDGEEPEPSEPGPRPESLPAAPAGEASSSGQARHLNPSHDQSSAR